MVRWSVRGPLRRGTRSQHRRSAWPSRSASPNYATCCCSSPNPAGRRGGISGKDQGRGGPRARPALQLDGSVVNPRTVARAAVRGRSVEPPGYLVLELNERQEHPVDRERKIPIPRSATPILTSSSSMVLEIPTVEPSGLNFDRVGNQGGMARLILSGSPARSASSGTSMSTSISRVASEW